jgi:hypothetical protein
LPFADRSQHVGALAHSLEGRIGGKHQEVRWLADFDAVLVFHVQSLGTEVVGSESDGAARGHDTT